MSYQNVLCEYLIEHIQIEDKIVLEIGSDSLLQAAQHLAFHRPRLVVASNLSEHWAAADPSARIMVHRADARSLFASMGEDFIDVIVGIAVLEHIYDLRLALQQMLRLLRPGGILFLHGNPLWTSRKGHHLWVDIDGTAYRFNDEEKNPIPDWGHLLYSREELTSTLSTTIPGSHIDKIVKWIYGSPAINRVSRSDILKHIEYSGAELIDISELTWDNDPDQNTLRRLEAQYGAEERYHVSELRAILKKPLIR